MPPSARPPTPVEDTDRLAALQATKLLDSPAEASFDRLTRLVQPLLGVPVSLVSLVDTERQFFKSSAGLPEPWCTLRQTPLSHSFCQHVVASEAPLVVEDARRHPLLLDNLAIRDLNVIAYLGIPLRAPSGHVIGSLCAIDAEPRAWSEDDVRILSELAELVMTEIALQYELRLRLEAQRALAEKAAQLKAANDSKDRFFSILAHDLRNPISALVMMSEALYQNLDTFDETDLREFVYRMSTSASDFHTLLENLLTWSRLQTGMMRYQPQWIDIEDQVHFLGRVLESPCEEKHIALTIRIAPQTHTWADPDMLQSVLLNLLTNAVKFTEPGGSVVLEVSSSGEMLNITVRDTGVGITEAQQVKLFRLDQASSTRGTAGEKGTGLGLILCKEMVEHHGSPLQVTSSLGGTSFSFSLPATRPTLS